MPFVFSHVEYCDMHFVYGFCNGNSRASVEEYRTRFPDLKIPSRRVFTRIHQTLRDKGCFPSVSVSSERQVVGTINTRENILAMVEKSPRLLTRRMASVVFHICRCCERYMRKTIFRIMINRYILNQATMLNVWISVAGYKHIPNC